MFCYRQFCAAILRAPAFLILGTGTVTPLYSSVTMDATKEKEPWSEAVSCY